MDATGSDVMMKVDGMTCEGCADTVRRTIQKLDPGARVTVDLERGWVTASTKADTLEVTAALTQAGYSATAMAG
jgi:copper chaperone